jgi:hypothetical protein
MLYNAIESVLEMPREVKCQLCGNEFTCAIDAGGCWCEDVKLTEALNELKTLTSDCVCHDCLRRFATVVSDVR